MRYVAWLVVYLVISLVSEFVAELTRALNTDEQLKPAAVVWFILLGCAGGFATAAVVSDRFLPPGPFDGVSVLTLPFFLGAALAFVGWIRGAARTHFASWYGGAACGLGLALGRLMGLAQHVVTFEAVVDRVARTPYPKCVAGARACPPEDCGGAWGYESLLRIIGDPSHEEHEGMMEWLGGEFDPEAFEPAQVRFDNPKKRWKNAFGEG